MIFYWLSIAYPFILETEYFSLILHYNWLSIDEIRLSIDYDWFLDVSIMIESIYSIIIVLSLINYISHTGSE